MMPGTKKTPDKKYSNWGGRRTKDGVIANGAPGVARVEQRKNPGEVAEHRTTVRYGDSFKQRFEVFREPDETTTDLFLRLLTLGLEVLEAETLKQASEK